MFFDVSYLSYLPSLVGRPQLAGGNARLEATRSAAQVAGPGIAGTLVGTVGAPAAIAADAVSFGASAALIGLIRGRETPPARADREPLRVELWEGVRYVFGQPYLRSLTLCTGAWNLFASASGAIFLVYVVRRLGLGPEVIGAVFVAANITLAAGALLSGRVVRRLGLGRTIAWSGIVASAGYLFAPAAPVDRPIPFLVAGGLVAGFAGMLYNVNQLSLRQAITPERLMGRMNSVVRFMYWGTIPAGSALGGVLASTVGLRATLWVGAAAAIGSMLPLAVSPVRRLEAIPEAAVA